jgi:alpha-1,2-mannosyltransferase
MTRGVASDAMTARDRVVAALCACVALALVHVAMMFKTSAKQRRRVRGVVRGAGRGRVIGFYHPSGGDGGGGERVLFAAIAAAQRGDFDGDRRGARGDDADADAAEKEGEAAMMSRADERRDARSDVRSNSARETREWRATEGRDVTCCVYAGATSARGDEPVEDGDELIARARERFGIELRAPINVIRLTRERWARAETYKRCTILGQFIGGAWLGLEALWTFAPDVFVDTVGHAATYPIARYLFGCQTVAYVHYPTVSRDMIARVESGRLMYNNSRLFASSKFLSGLKVLYYRAFAVVYGWCGRSCKCVMVNSSWTKSHIDALWRVDSRVVYPPCNVEDLSKLPLTRPRLNARGTPVKKDKSSIRVVSVGQFRPEKAHVVQIAAWKALKKFKTLSSKIENAILVFVGGCRDEADRERLADLQQSVKDLELQDSVQFHVDVPYDEVKRELSRASIGLHSMIDEHFGICVVEYMAAGAVPVAHASGGPFLDIIRDQHDGPTGFTADSVATFAETLEHLLLMRRTEREEISARARARSDIFSETEFNSNFIDSLVNSGVL